MKSDKHIPTTSQHFLLWMFVLIVLSYPHQQLLAQASNSTRQKKDQLELQMKKLRSEIAEMEKAIAQTTSKKKESLDQVEVLRSKIKKRESLISNYSNQIEDLEDDISTTKSTIELQTVQIEQMKKEYALMLRKTYSNLALQNQYSFLISASSFNEAIARYGYLKRISDYRRQQAVAIDMTIRGLEVTKENLEGTKRKKQNLLLAQSEQKEKLESEKVETDKMIEQLDGKEQKLKKYVKDKNKAVQALNNKIQKIIEEEIKLARKKPKKPLSAPRRPLERRQ